MMIPLRKDDIGEPTVFVVDDDEAMRSSLECLLQSVPIPVELFASAEDYLEHFDPDRPGCLLVDMRMPGKSGLDLQTELASLKSEMPIIFITAYGEVPSTAQAFRGGALDFLEKPFSSDRLLNLVRRAIALDGERRQLRYERERREELLSQLSPREHQVMAGIVAGKTNKMMAEELDLAPKTIENHRARLMQKLGLHSVAALVKLAVSPKKR